MKIITLILLLFCYMFSGCGDKISSPVIPVSNLYLTDNGYVLNIPDSVFQHGLYLSEQTITDRLTIETTLKGWLDARIDEWANEDIDKFNITKQVNYILFDHWFFDCSVTPTGMCAGAPFGNTIYACIYDKYESSDFPSYNYPPHTLIQHIDDDGDQTMKWYAGKIEGIGLSVIGYELTNVMNENVN